MTLPPLLNRRRLEKEIASYVKERETEMAKLSEMKKNNADAYDVKQMVFVSIDSEQIGRGREADGANDSLGGEGV